jgi:hypothetical protein
MILLFEPQREISERQKYLRPITNSIDLSMMANFILVLA